MKMKSILIMSCFVAFGCAKDNFNEEIVEQTVNDVDLNSEQQEAYTPPQVTEPMVINAVSYGGDDIGYTMRIIFELSSAFYESYYSGKRCQPFQDVSGLVANLVADAWRNQDEVRVWWKTHDVSKCFVAVSVVEVNSDGVPTITKTIGDENYMNEIDEKLRILEHEGRDPSSEAGACDSVNDPTNCRAS